MNSINIFIVLALIFVASHAAITRPDKVLSELDTIKVEVFGYQSLVQEKIKNLRASSGEVTGDHFNKTLSIVDENIRKIAVSDIGIRGFLAEQKQTACIINLVNFVDQIIELSGYAISNCIEIKESANTNNSDFKDLLDTFERDVNVLAEVIVNALVGRNIFTEGDAILQRVRDQIAAKSAEFEAVLNALADQSNGVTNSLESEISKLNTCFAEINGSIESGIGAVEPQISICIKFSGRGARSAPVVPFRASDFFPQL